MCPPQLGVYAVISNDTNADSQGNSGRASLAPGWNQRRGGSIDVHRVRRVSDSTQRHDRRHRGPGRADAPSGLGVVGQGGHDGPASVPPTIQVPAVTVLLPQDPAIGTQSYTSRQTSNGCAWTLARPSATLVDDNGKQIVTHHAGPTWKARDGSTVGARVDSATVSGDAIPWLEPKAARHDLRPAPEHDRRPRPASGCDAGTLDAAPDVPCTADHYFCRAGRSR